jgi:hypothetical protein
MNRGMNAALAVHGDYAYIGSRTDGGHEGMPHGGVMVVDISEPEDPVLLTETPILGPAPGESTRELRVWRSQGVLIVLNTNCGVGDTLHHCTAPTVPSIRFYDIRGDNATDPRLLTQLNVNTHEFFLWEDPNDPGRALIFAGNAGSSCSEPPDVPAPTCPFSVWDISSVRSGETPETLFSGLHGYTRFPAAPAPVQKPTGGLHSLSVSNDGQRAYFALLTGGFAVVDVSDFANGIDNPQPRRITINENRPTGPGRGPTARSSSGGVTGSTSPTRCTGRPRAPATAVPGAGRGWSTSPTRPRRPSRRNTGFRRTTRRPAPPGIRRARRTPPITRR